MTAAEVGQCFLGLSSMRSGSPECNETLKIVLLPQLQRLAALTVTVEDLQNVLAGLECYNEAGAVLTEFFQNAGKDTLQCNREDYHDVQRLLRTLSAWHDNGQAFNWGSSLLSVIDQVRRTESEQNCWMTSADASMRSLSTVMLLSHQLQCMGEDLDHLERCVDAVQELLRSVNHRATASPSVNRTRYQPQDSSMTTESRQLQADLMLMMGGIDAVIAKSARVGNTSIPVKILTLYHDVLTAAVGYDVLRLNNATGGRRKSFSSLPASMTEKDQLTAMNYQKLRSKLREWVASDALKASVQANRVLGSIVNVLGTAQARPGSNRR